MLTKAPRGTKDILPAQVHSWVYLENIIRQLVDKYNYAEIRTPIFEHTELFQRGIGDTTDVVEKEMYSFIDRGERSITLRPENTASAVRAFLEHKLYADNAFTKLFYIGSMFRYDRPQAGRYREFHQFGVEALGEKSAMADAEVIALAVEFLHRLGLKDTLLKINSVGCPNCRPVYRERLQEYFRDHLSEMCSDCQSRFDRNPLRLLDCKNPHCKEIGDGAPSILDCLCDECHDHFADLQKYLRAIGIDYEIDPTLVRGLDYYTKTAFELKYLPLGAQSSILGGGRYDGLVEECGGPVTPAVGFATGLERVLLALEMQNLLPAVDNSVDIAIVALGENVQAKAFEVLQQLRYNGYKVFMDFGNKSMKSQMKQANKQGSTYCLILGEDELARDAIIVKDMKNSSQTEMSLADLFVKFAQK